MTQVVAAVVVTLLVGGAGATAFISGGGASDPDRADREAGAKDEELGGEARELIRLLENQKTLTYHARYEAEDDGEGATTFETWQTASQLRQDTVFVTKGQEVASITIITPDQRTQCTATQGQPWSCRDATEEDVAAADPVGVVLRQLRGATVTARDDQNAGEPTRCFAVARGDQRLELCVLADRGIPTWVRGGAAELQLTALDADVDEKVFAPPAK